MENKTSFNTPILFIIFNRPDRAQLIFDEIKKQKPKYLYIHADGPRQGNTSDIEKCKASRKIIQDQVDWNCKLNTLFRDENKGCGHGPASAITWFFENVEEGIILEDDCLPHPDFFSFCSIMLEKYRNQPQVLSIAGSNFQDGIKRDKGSYYFSVHNRIWGWATWRRTWAEYSYTLDNIDSNSFDIIVKTIFSSKTEKEHWKLIFDTVKRDRMSDSCWDYQFMFMLWLRRGLTVVPNVNLISNIGDGEDATHTNWIDNPNLRRKSESIYPLVFNEKIKRNVKADKYYFKHFILVKKSVLKKVLIKIIKIFFKI